MFKPKLAQPRPKKHTRYNRKSEGAAFVSRPYQPKLHQPLPIPIASLTGIQAGNSVWRWYRGNLKKRKKQSAISSSLTSSESDGNIVPESLYYYIEIAPDNEAHANFSQMGFFGESEESLATYRDSSKTLKGNDTYVILEDFNPEIIFREESISETSESTNVPKSEDSHVEKESDDVDYLRLELYEAFFLTYGLGCLIVNDCDNNGEEMSIDDMWDKFCHVDVDFPQKYAVYHHFRSKGWVVKNGMKFAVDFLLYKDGPPFYHATYSVWIRNHIKENKDHNRDISAEELDWTSLSGLNRVTESAGKELLIVDILEEKEMKVNKNTVSEFFESIRLEELLVRRWVPSSEKKDSIDSEI